jgi:hypothetical protein
MVRAAAEKHSPARPVPVIEQFRQFKRLIADVLAAARTSRQRVEKAHAARCTLASFSDAEFHDTGIDPSDATGIPSWQPDLPFFMQSGFGRK